MDKKTPKDTYNAAIGWLESCGDKKSLDYKKIKSLVNQYYLSVKVKKELAIALDVLGVPHT